MKLVTITLPEELVKVFLEHEQMAPWISDRYGCAGCNDLRLENTVDNRQLIEMAEAYGRNMSVEEYRSSGEEYIPLGTGEWIYGTDFAMFDWLVGLIKEQIKEQI